MTWLQNEMNSDVTRFTTHEKKVAAFLLQDRFERVW